MSSGNFASTVDLRLRPSRRALQLALWVHALPAAMLPFCLPTGWPMVAVAGLIALSWVALRQHPALGMGRRTVSRVVWDSEGEWRIWVGGSAQAVTLLDHSIVHGQWLLLRWQRVDDGKRYSRLLLGDEVGADGMRRLRARLSMLG